MNAMGSDADSDNTLGDAMSTIWENRAPTQQMTIKLSVLRKTFYYLKSLKIQDVKRIWPLKETGWRKEDQEQLLHNIKRFCDQEHRESGDYVVVTEKYSPPKSGFPGRLHSAGCQGQVRAIRSNVLEGTSDLDMKSAMPKSIGWTCSEFGVLTPHLTDYINNPDAALAQIMEDMRVSRGKAKQLVITTLTYDGKLKGAKGLLKKIDDEAKEIQPALMRIPELQWILPYCKDENKAGSFMSHLYHFIECKLVMRVYRMLVDEFGVDVAAIVFDGLNIADKSKHGNQQILDRASAVCEEVCPGIGMMWAWKELDFVLESKDKKPLTNEDGSSKELRVPADFTPPRPQPADVADEDDEDDKLDPLTEPSYEVLRLAYSLNNGDNPNYGIGKVGTVYIKKEVRTAEDGSTFDFIELYDAGKLKELYAHATYFYLVKGKRKSAPFITRWMHDNKMDSEYLHDKSKRYFWTHFTMCPETEKCPIDYFNLWRGFYAETLPSNYDADARADLKSMLEFINGLCSGNAAQYNFLLDILAHLIQYPEIKLGIALCLVGIQGAGKGRLWRIIERLVGTSPATYVTANPHKNVYGDNNGNIREALFIRITEANKKAMAGHIGHLRTYITDSPVETRSLFCKAFNIANFTRFFFDTNFVDAIQDDEEERRYFIVQVSLRWANDTSFFAKLDRSIESDDGIRALFDFLKLRSIKARYGKKDIPVGAFQKVLKQSNQEQVVKFIKWVVEQQDVDDVRVNFTDDEIVEMFVEYKGGGDAVKDKNSILSTLKLKAMGMEGLTRSDSNREHRPGVFKPGTDDVLKTFYVTKYHLDLTQLRTKFEICSVDHAAPVAMAEIDCEADIVAWELKLNAVGAAAKAAVEVEEEEDESKDESRGRG